MTSVSAPSLNPRRQAAWLLLPIPLALVISALDPTGPPLSGWRPYLVLSAVAGLALWAGWRSLASDRPPNWLLGLMIGAFVLRMALALVLVYALPVYGYDEDPQNAGYVFYDSYARDEDAWARARSDQSILSPFTDRRPTDQYGGLLFLSMAIYRFLSPDAHRPLLIVVLGAAASSLGVAYAWAFARRVFADPAARWAAWIAALYPEAMLLASAQMREPFLGTAVALALCGYSWATGEKERAGRIAIATAIALTLFLSPPTALLILVMLVAMRIWQGGMKLKGRGVAAAVALGLGMVALVLIWQAWSTVGGLSGTSPLYVVRGWWESVAGEWRLRLLIRDSDWAALVLDNTPGWTHVPFLVLLGLIHPFLPAAIADPGNPLWRAISIWRSLGWYLLLPLLLYAPWAALRKGNSRSMAGFLAVLVWSTAILAAFRASSYQWDSPRYRAVFLVAQAALAGWAWAQSRREHSPWLGRVAGVTGFSVVVALQWYLGRYYDTPFLALPQTFALILLGDVLILGGGWALDRARRAKPTLTDGRPDV